MLASSCTDHFFALWFGHHQEKDWRPHQPAIRGKVVSLRDVAAWAATKRIFPTSHFYLPVPHEQSQPSLSGLA
jgi:hypothetical protein